MNYLEYQFTIEDPKVLTRPWTSAWITPAYLATCMAFLFAWGLAGWDGTDARFVALIATAFHHDRSLAGRMLDAPELPAHWRAWALDPAAPV